jgi:hypothetical protein
MFQQSRPAIMNEMGESVVPARGPFYLAVLEANDATAQKIDRANMPEHPCRKDNRRKAIHGNSAV